jgi:hypothetical protein
MERYKLKSPSAEVHARAKAFSEVHGRLFVDNERRLSLSVGVEDGKVLQQLETLGVRILPDFQYDIG